MTGGASPFLPALLVPPLTVETLAILAARAGRGRREA
jgi:hypothetical protein